MSEISLGTLLAPFPGLESTLDTEHEICSIEEFKRALPYTRWCLERGLSIHNIVSLRKTLSVRCPDSLTDHAFMNLREVLHRVIETEGGEGYSLWSARRKAKRLVVSPTVAGGGTASILADDTVELHALMGTSDVETWPSVYNKRGYVMTWDLVLPDPRPRYSPFSGEEIVCGKTSLYDFTGIPYHHLGFLVYLARNPRTVDNLSGWDIVTGLKTLDMTNDPRFLKAHGEFKRLTPRGQFGYHESLFTPWEKQAAPRESNPTT